MNSADQHETDTVFLVIAEVVTQNIVLNIYMCLCMYNTIHVTHLWCLGDLVHCLSIKIYFTLSRLYLFTHIYILYILSIRNYYLGSFTLTMKMRQNI